MLKGGWNILMKDQDKYSCTSNTVKLLKHLDKLKSIQEGKIIPIMAHIIPTHKCQLKCVHCCFRNRKDKLADMSWEVWETGITQFLDIGVKAYEFTGGGDPMLWSHINEASRFLKNNGAHIGLITNGLAVKDLDDPLLFDWIRVSLNTLDYSLDLDFAIDFLKKWGANVSFCYIWNIIKT